MNTHLTLLVSFLMLTTLSCSDEKETKAEKDNERNLDQVIEEAMREADFDRPGDESVSIRYFTEEKAR